MSYSISAAAQSKTEVLLALEAKFANEVLPQQPVHAKDQEIAFSNVRRHLALAVEPNGDQDVMVSMYGSISVNDSGHITSCSSGCSVYIQPHV